MRKIISDYDGIMIETEFAKAFGWYLACKSLKEDKDISPLLIDEIKKGQSSVEEKLLELSKGRMNDLEEAKACAGGTTFDFGKRIWQRFYICEEREPNEKETKFINEVLIPRRSGVRDQLIDWFAEPIEGNLRFFKVLYETMRETYHDNHPIGLVNQSKSKGLKKQFEMRRNDASIWVKFPDLPKIFGQYSERGFPYAECAGDGRVVYSGVPKKEVKKVAYDILCGKLGVRPEETMSFEDTKDGVVAAKNAGVLCVGIKSDDSLQDLSESPLVIVGNLERIVDMIPAIIRGSPKEVFAEIVNYLSGEAGFRYSW